MLAEPFSNVATAAPGGYCCERHRDNQAPGGSEIPPQFLNPSRGALVRSVGSYPIARGFNSLPRNHLLADGGAVTVGDPLPRAGAGQDEALYVFVPAAEAACCADCHGYFVARLGHCPGCGSNQYVLPSTAPVASAEKGDDG